MILEQCFHLDEKSAEESSATGEARDPGSGTEALPGQLTVNDENLSGIKHRREQPQHGPACDVSFLAINKLSSAKHQIEHASVRPSRNTSGASQGLARTSEDTISTQFMKRALLSP